MHKLALLAALLPLASAHFTIEWPKARGTFDEEKEPEFPCGGQNDIGERTDFPLSGAPIQIKSEHLQSNVQVVLALGEKDLSYSINLVPTFMEMGPQKFCIGNVTVPSNLNVKEGDKGTLQVILSSDDSANGLYQCADVTFTSKALSESDYKSKCINDPGTSMMPAAQPNKNANGTNTDGSSSSPAATTSSKAIAPHATVAPMLAVGAGVMGALAYLN